MNLFFLRHGIAAEKGTYAKDADRPLTEEGKKEMRKISKGMLALDLDFDLILTSPFVRARETAEIVAAALKAEDRLRINEDLQVGGDPLKLIRGFNRSAESLENILWVGHEPYLSNLISFLLSGTGQSFASLKKGSLCKLEAEALKYGKCAEMKWLLTPKQLMFCGK